MRILDDETCLSLLGSVRLGRVGLTYQALPVILPVSFALCDRNVLFGVGPGALAKAAVTGQIVCFEADSMGTEFRETWSVCAVGRLSVLTSADEIAEARRLDLGYWSPLSRRFIRLVPEIFSGRSGMVA